jgi:hypothetical protein
LGEACRPREGCKQVLILKVLVVGKDFLMSHTAAEEFEEGFNRVAKAANAGFAMANVRGGGDSSEKVFGIHEFSLDVREQETSGAYW